MIILHFDQLLDSEPVPLTGSVTAVVSTYCGPAGCTPIQARLRMDGSSILQSVLHDKLDLGLTYLS